MGRADCRGALSPRSQASADGLPLSGKVRAVRAPGFTLPDQSGTPWPSEDALARGALVVILYRGDW